MATYFSNTDVTQLNDYAKFSLGIPASLKALEKTLNLGFFHYLVQAHHFGVQTLTAQAKLRAETWQAYPAAHRALHSEFQKYNAEVTRRSERLLRASNLSELSGLISYANPGADSLSKLVSQHEENLNHLAASTYAVVPRLTDYLYSNLYTYTGWQNTLANPNGNVYHNSLLAIVLPKDPEGTRRIEALHVIEHYQNTYALSYMAASNLCGHFIRLKEMTALCRQHVIELRSLKDIARVKFKLRILLSVLSETQRMYATLAAPLSGRT